MITFEKNGLTSLTIAGGRITPYSPEDQILNQETYLTESSNPKVVNYGSNLNLIKLVLKNLSKDNYDGSTQGIKTWFETSTINWSSASFTLKDEFGTDYLARLWQNKFSVKARPNSRYDITIILKVD